MITLQPTNQLTLPRLSPSKALLLLIIHQPPKTHGVRPAEASVSHGESGPSGSRETRPDDDEEDRELMSRNDLEGRDELHYGTVPLLSQQLKYAG